MGREKGYGEIGSVAGGEAPQGEGTTDWRCVLFGLSLGVLAAYQQFKLPPALPLLLKTYGYERAVAGAFMSIYAVAGLLLSVPVGRVLGREGPRRLLVSSFLLLLAGNAAGLAAPASGWAMLGSRLLEGLGCATLAVVGAVVTTTSAAPRHRPVAIALWATWIPMGQVLGTAIAIPSVSAGYWRPLWWFAAFVTLALAAWGHRLKGAGLGALLPPKPSAAPAAPVGPGGSGPDRKLLLALASCLFGLWSVQYITYVTWLPQYLVEAHGFAPGAAARAYLIPSVLTIVFNLAGGAMLRRGTRMGWLLAGSVAVQGAVWFAVPLTRNLAQGLLSLVAYGVSSGVTATALFALPAALFGAQAGKGFGGIMAGRNLGVLVGPILLGQLVTWYGSWEPIPVVFGSVCVLYVLLGSYIARQIGDVRRA